MRGLASALEISAKIIRENSEDAALAVFLIQTRMTAIAMNPEFSAGNKYLSEFMRGFQAALDGLSFIYQQTEERNV